MQSSVFRVQTYLVPGVGSRRGSPRCAPGSPLPQAPPDPRDGAELRLRHAAGEPDRPFAAGREAFEVPVARPRTYGFDRGAPALGVARREPGRRLVEAGLPPRALEELVQAVGAEVQGGDAHAIVQAP